MAKWLVLFSLFLSLSAIAQSLPIQDLVKQAEGELATSQPISFESKALQKVGPEIWDRLEVNIVNNKVSIQYLYSETSLKQSEIIFRDLAFLRWLRESISSNIDLPLKTELLFNATHGSASSRWALLHSTSEVFVFGNGKTISTNALNFIAKTLPATNTTLDSEDKIVALANKLDASFLQETEKQRARTKNQSLGVLEKTDSPSRYFR